MCWLGRKVVSAQSLIWYFQKPESGPHTHTKQGVTKRCRLSWLTNSALVYEPKCGGRGSCGVSANEIQLCTWGPNKLWRSNFIFNLLHTHTRFWFLNMLPWHSKHDSNMQETLRMKIMVTSSSIEISSGHRFKDFELSPLSGLRFNWQRFGLALAGYSGQRDMILLE